MYNLTLTVLGTDYKSKGETIEEAFENLTAKWSEIKSKGVIKVSRGKKEYTRMMNLPMIRRIMANSTTRTLWANRFELLLD